MSSIVNIIVRFEVQADEAGTLVELIRDFFKNEVSNVPGFISAKLHLNAEKTVVINYATWESVDHFKKFMTEFAMHSERSLKIREYKPGTDIVFEVPF